MDFRSALDQVMLVVGVMAIVVPVSLYTEGWMPLLAVFVGILLIGLGTWRAGSRLLADRRTYVGLRSEVESFIDLVRHLNEKALSGETDAIEGLRTRMKESVDRMITLAGQADAAA